MRFSKTPLEDLIDVGGNGTWKVLRQLRQIGAAQQMISGHACVAGLLLEPAQVHPNALNGADARRRAEPTGVDPFEPRRDVDAIEGGERDGLGVEPDVKMAKGRPMASDRRSSMCRCERCRKAHDLWVKLGTSRPEAFRIEGKKLPLVEPTEVPKETTTMDPTKSGLMRSKRVMKEPSNLGRIEISNGPPAIPKPAMKQAQDASRRAMWRQVLECEWRKAFVGIASTHRRRARRL